MFYKAAPVKKQALCKLLSVSAEKLESAATDLQQRLSGGGTQLFVTDTELALGTAPGCDSLIESIRKDELKRDIGKAGAETLAIVLYRGPVNRTEIDRIRGVNSAYILRNLQIRGLIEKKMVGRQTQFQPTTELLQHLGITDKTNLKDYAQVMNALEQYEQQLTETS